MTTIPPAAVVDALRSATEILCVSHVNPDGDAVGSLLGLGWMLRQLGRQPVLALQDRVPANVEHLPGAEEIAGPTACARRFELIVCLDASSPDRMGSVYQPEVHDGIPLIVIDHHVTNTRFGAVNWVDPTCAATCQMLVDLAGSLAVSLAGNVAECLLTGIVTDTQGFRTSNTDASLMAAALRLVQTGTRLPEVMTRTLVRRPFAVIRLWGLVLPAVQLDEGVIWTTVSAEHRALAGSDPADDGQLSSFLIAADEADISATFTETESGSTPAVECSFRAKPGFDVAQVALSLGGGGHPAASGCTLPGRLDEVAAQVVPLLQSVRQQRGPC